MSGFSALECQFCIQSRHGENKRNGQTYSTIVFLVTLQMIDLSHIGPSLLQVGSSLVDWQLPGVPMSSPTSWLDDDGDSDKVLWRCDWQEPGVSQEKEDGSGETKSLSSTDSSQEGSYTLWENCKETEV